ncbi:MAG: hypothetical protein Q4B14_07140 [Clostridia bacterium]|nr:hypothetical protein [Clostridia bacterium]
MKKLTAKQNGICALIFLILYVALCFFNFVDGNNPSTPAMVAIVASAALAISFANKCG